MTNVQRQLREAVEALEAAERLLAAYVASKLNREVIIKDLIIPFDAQQREAMALGARSERPEAAPPD
jgi:hypothetical protein